MKAILTILSFFTTIFLSYSQVCFTINDGIQLLISNPNFIESTMHYYGFEYFDTQGESKFHIYKKRNQSHLEFTFTSTNNRINVINWKEILTDENYRIFVAELTKLDFNKIENSLVNDFSNTSMESFDNLKMNCLISIIKNYKKGFISIIISRKDKKKPIIMPDKFTTFQGLKIFNDNYGGWSLLINIKNDQITIEKRPQPINEYWKTKRFEPLLISGSIKNGIIYSSFPESEAKEIHPSMYKYFKGHMYEINTENTYNQYIAAPDTMLINEEKISEDIDVSPDAKIGMKNLIAELQKIHPSQQDIEEGINGTIIIGFIVEKDGILTSLKIIKTPSEDLANLYIDYLKNTKFYPAIKDGKPVRSNYRLPIKINFTNSY
ncbi:energy transducer TonB [Sphingobacterium siyangense]|uniref:energy transducer TonB n=1 Tax=Sphingobacterium siyangense TaxID=459529 RepID=UPI003DA4F363